MRSVLLFLAGLLIASSSMAQTPLSSHRLIFAPTAKPIPAGQWTVGLTEVILPNTALGLGRGISLATGTIVNPYALGTIWVEPKWTVVNRDELAIAIGVSGIANPRYNPGYGSRGQGAATAFAVASIAASSVSDVTLGVGMRANVRSLFGGWKSDGISDRVIYDREFYADEVPSHETVVVPSPVLFAGVETRLSERVTWVSELGMLPDQHVRYGISSLCTGCPLPPMPLRETPVLDRGRVTRDVTLGSVLRYQSGRVGLDAGLVSGWTAQEISGTEHSLIPWISGTVALTK